VIAVTTTTTNKVVIFFASFRVLANHENNEYINFGTRHLQGIIYWLKRNTAYSHTVHRKKEMIM
jgi:hypothetical protein